MMGSVERSLRLPVAGPVPTTQAETRELLKGDFSNEAPSAA